jgi:hypothetical protein
MPNPMVTDENLEQAAESESGPPLVVSPLQIYALVGYYTILLAVALALLILLISRQDSAKPALLVMIGFVAGGAIVGSVLYQIRMLFKYYIKDGKFDRRWIGKYISAPWEAVALALVVLSLLQGGGVILGGRKIQYDRGQCFCRLRHWSTRWFRHSRSCRMAWRPGTDDVSDGT